MEDILQKLNYPKALREVLQKHQKEFTGQPQIALGKLNSQMLVPNQLITFFCMSLYPSFHREDVLYIRQLQLDVNLATYMYDWIHDCLKLAFQNCEQSQQGVKFLPTIQNYLSMLPSGVITPIHKLYLECCVSAKAFKQADQFLRATHVMQLIPSPQTFNKESELSTSDTHLYFYYAALVCINLQNYKEAINYLSFGVQLQPYATTDSLLVQNKLMILTRMMVKGSNNNSKSMNRGAQMDSESHEDRQRAFQDLSNAKTAQEIKGLLETYRIPLSEPVNSKIMQYFSKDLSLAPLITQIKKVKQTHNRMKAELLQIDSNEDLIRVNEKINDFWIDMRSKQLDFKYSGQSCLGLNEVGSLKTNLEKLALMDLQYSNFVSG